MSANCTAILAPFAVKGRLATDVDAIAPMALREDPDPEWQPI